MVGNQEQTEKVKKVGKVFEELQILGKSLEEMAQFIDELEEKLLPVLEADFVVDKSEDDRIDLTVPLAVEIQNKDRTLEQSINRLRSIALRIQI